jgi:hypothetical protein
MDRAVQAKLDREVIYALFVDVRDAYFKRGTIGD